MASPTLKVIGFFCLIAFSIYSAYFSDSKNLVWLALAGLGAVFSYWWLEDRDARKAREEKRFQELSSRVTDLERQIPDLERQIRELQRIASRDGTCGTRN